MLEVLLHSKKNPPLVFQYLGEVASSGFIDEPKLSKAVGLTQGTVMTANQSSGWLMFTDAVDQKVKFLSKKPLRHGVSWNQLNALGLVDGTAIVEIGNYNYRVRLVTGGDTGGGLMGDTTIEWDRLVYSISMTRPLLYMGNHFANHTNADLGVATSGNGQWCLTRTRSGNNAVARGNPVLARGTVAPSSALPNYHWRPLLERIGI